MTDIRVKFDSSEVRKVLAEIDKDFERATMYGLRAAGRVGKQTAKRNAPKLSGRLGGSIHSSKRLKRVGKNAFTLNVGPWGERVNFYRTKANKEHPYMEPALKELHGKMGEKFEQAYTRVLQKRGRI